MKQKPSTPKTRPSDEWIEIGKIIGVQGLNGEVRVYPSTDFPERFEEPGQRWLKYPNQSTPQPVELVQGRLIENKGIFIVQLAEVTDRNQAEALRGCVMLVPEGDRPHLEEDEYYIQDLIGLVAIDQRTGEEIGTVVEILTAGHDILAIKPPVPAVETPDISESPETLETPSKRKSKPNILIPFVKEIVPIVDMAAGRVEINPPPGLLEVNN
ncbi:ribosome maturation factor RimM [Laspinema olomoucense]|uniref:ribosome maturation factor RimM n=1 Tax=Laspinema olomoucense TaxID=3231600 RepID=UPI0021BA3EE9|nr:MULTISPECIES: ribosome maturation factor RimM [unclassified Laspinema]MCT7973770.1 ribosome maturation factor RimM [Laspinema sp. D3d]MCT7988047.1 ribosome maturation factor RimM [Laspinema sp. D3a]